jgi:hypothetical protein
VKHLLVSTCSVIALLVPQTRPASAANFTLSSNITDFGDTLVNCAAFAGCVAAPTWNETATRNGSSGSDAITFGAASTPFSGTGGTKNFGGNKSTVTFSYGFAPTIAGAASESVSVTSANTQNFDLKGTGVAPVASVAVPNAAGTGGGTTNSGNLGDILVGSTATATVTVKNTGNGNLDTRQTTANITNLNGTQSFAGSSVFTGPATSTFHLTDSSSQAFTYTYAPTVRSNGATQSITATSAFTDGSADGKNTAGTINKTISGVAVAPVESGMTGGNAGFVLVGKSGSASVTVKNSGDGNKAGADNGTTLLSNLHGTVSPTNSGPFSLSGSNTVNLTDNTTGTFTYTYTPTIRTGVADSSKVTGNFSNGSSDGKNQATTDSATITGQAVAPIESGMTGGNAGFVLVGKSGSATVTVKNSGDGNLAGADSPTLQTNLHGSLSPTVSGPFSLSGSNTVNLTDNTTGTFTYTYTPTVRTGVADSAAITGNFSNGSSDGKNQATSGSANVTGQAVAPVNSVSTTDALARFSTSGASTGTASVTVNNIGDGNKAGADNGTTFLSNLHGTVGGPTPGTVFSGGGGTVNLKDSQSSTFNYTYAPTARGTDMANVAVNLSNGSSDGKNTNQVVNASLSGQGVGPTYQSRIGKTAASAPNGTINTPVANTPGSSPVDFGTVGAGTQHTLFLDIANISTDPNGGNSQLTDLSLLSFTIDGPQQNSFSVAAAPTVLHENGDHIVLPILFSPIALGSYLATLTIGTDASAAFGALGDMFLYSLSGLAVRAPEPGAALLFSIGLGALLAARRRRT